MVTRLQKHNPRILSVATTPDTGQGMESSPEGQDLGLQHTGLYCGQVSICLPVNIWCLCLRLEECSPSSSSNNWQLLPVKKNLRVGHNLLRYGTCLFGRVNFMKHSQEEGCLLNRWTRVGVWVWRGFPPAFASGHVARLQPPQPPESLRNKEEPTMRWFGTTSQLWSTWQLKPVSGSSSADRRRAVPWVVESHLNRWVTSGGFMHFSSCGVRSEMPTPRQTRCGRICCTQATVPGFPGLDARTSTQLHNRGGSRAGIYLSTQRATYQVKSLTDFHKRLPCTEHAPWKPSANGLVSISGGTWLREKPFSKGKHKILLCVCLSEFWQSILMTGTLDLNPN